MEKKVLIFGGTTEGRRLTEELSSQGVRVHVCVATEYGEILMPESSRITVSAGRMNREEMEELLKEGFLCAVDATHPYAVEVTKNLKSACDATDTAYFRLLREELEKPMDHLIQVGSAREAADYLRQTEGNVLLTTGSKELDQFLSVPNYQQRLYPRVLPSISSLAWCLELGYSPKQIICMQGPFSVEMNLAVLRQYQLRWLVTKESGKAGGLPEKLQAAREAKAKVLLIGRPVQEEGYSYSQLFQQLQKLLSQQTTEQPPACKECGSIAAPSPSKEGYFPFFVPIRGKRIQVFGGGKIAARRIRTLLPFGCRIEVTAPEVCPELRTKAEAGEIVWKKAVWQPGRCCSDLVLAATNIRGINQRIMEECRKKQIPVNTADCQEDCDFFFPAIVQSGWITAGISSGGKDHALVKQAAAAVREVLSRMEKERDCWDGKTGCSDREPGKPAGGSADTACDGQHPPEPPRSGAGAGDDENHRG